MDIEEPFESTNLQNIPTEVFNHIASYLEPVWLYNLSHSYKRAWHQLCTKESGNLSWYRVMPSTMWMEQARYQENEAPEYGCLGPKDRLDVEIKNVSGAAWAFRRSNLSGRLSVSTPLGSFNLSQHPFHFHSTETGTDATAEADLSPKMILGGAYRPNVDYRKETIGRMKTERCHICFAYSTTSIGRQIRKQWGVRWCAICLMNNTIGEERLSILVGDETILCMAKALNFTTKSNVKRYLRPSASQSLVNLRYVNLELLELAIRRARFDCGLLLSQASKLEDQRRQLRHLIVKLAESIWEGKPIAHILKATGRRVRVKPNSPMHSVDSEQYRWHRERYAPTHKMKQFLFPAYKMSESAVNMPIEDGVFLHDPTEDLLGTTAQVIEKVKSTDIVKETRNMLKKLVRVSKFDSRAKLRTGNTVTSWINAAKEWHTKRLYDDIESGVVLEASKQMFAYRRPSSMPNLVLGLASLLAIESNVELSKHASPATWFIDDDKFVGSERITLARRIAAGSKLINKDLKTFQKVLVETCCECPVSLGYIYPAGLDNLLDHICKAHPEVFFSNDNFTITG